MATISDSDRISRLEGEIAHMATKADMEQVMTAVERAMTAVERAMTAVERVRADLSRQILILGAVNVAVVSAGIAFLKLTG